MVCLRNVIYIIYFLNFIILLCIQKIIRLYFPNNRTKKNWKRMYFSRFLLFHLFFLGISCYISCFLYVCAQSEDVSLKFVLLARTVNINLNSYCTSGTYKLAFCQRQIRVNFQKGIFP